MISFLLAMDEHGTIGKDNQLPWHLPNDLKHFKKLTMGHAIIMGRKTFQSIGQALPGRRNIVLTRNPNFHAEGCEVYHTPQAILNELPADEEAFVIGGAQVFEAFKDVAARMYITRIEHTFAGDTTFTFNPNEWTLVSDTPGTVDEKNRYPHRFLVYEKKR
ncbi:dihydrofolate reductase [Tuberibacillus calidus]|jgi:dihydrofolate reductase|uniref:dihydrofolate reductase n=1 Tax=Tuberibacillus calidus TaxID=340097 RepID=UPI0004295154|nr:dihydrofolate reductase [Tuberibacillus calidus]